MIHRKDPMKLKRRYSMVKDIMKVILSCIAAYPICFILAYLEFSRESYMWLVLLIIDIIVCSVIIVCIAFKHKKRKK